MTASATSLRAALNPAIRFTGVDLSPSMLASAQTHVAEHKLDNVALVPGDPLPTLGELIRSNRRLLVFAEEGGSYVFVQGPEGWIKKKVELGMPSFTMVSIRSGLQQGGTHDEQHAALGGYPACGRRSDGR